jgi:hypothetical protein
MLLCGAQLFFGTPFAGTPDIPEFGSVNEQAASNLTQPLDERHFFDPKS